MYGDSPQPAAPPPAKLRNVATRPLAAHKETRASPAEGRHRHPISALCC
jgi:hypothetical protein